MIGDSVSFDSNMPDHLLPVVGFPVPVTFRSIFQRTVFPLGLLAATAFSGLSAQPGTKIEGMPGLPRTSGRSSVAALSRDIDAILADRSFADATWGISIVSCESGESIYRMNDGKNQQFASNIKLLTTAAALRKLGSEYRFRTDIYINGEITPAGDLIGDLVIKAGGVTSLARSTNYLALSLQLNRQASLSATGYYQPALRDLSDFRILVESNLDFRITQLVAWTTKTHYRFDSQPPSGLKRFDLELDNGISLTF
jgi:hypothetical protein